MLDEATTRPARIQPAESEPVPPVDSLIEMAAGELAAAQRPIIYCGGGAVSSGASKAISELAELLQCTGVDVHYGQRLVSGRPPAVPRRALGC